MCCHQGVLPQGAPTSPSLSNLVFQPLDGLLEAAAGERGAVYSRYADDLTFSADRDLSGLLPVVRELLLAQSFTLNGDKVHYYDPGVPKKITGLTVQNGSVRVPKGFKRKLRQEIYYCQKFGVLNHLNNCGAQRWVHYREHLYGKAYYIHMVEPEEGERYLQQLDRLQWPRL